jgi:Leucine-rich repeat (LRR) protein
MRITVELLSLAEQRTNPLQERELVLSGLGISSIENMGIVQDSLDCYDLSNNRIVCLENFAKAPRLSHLLCANNTIERIDPINVAKNVPNLRFLVLANNRITSLAFIAELGKACPKLEFLDLTGNSVTRKCMHGW